MTYRLYNLLATVINVVLSFLSFFIILRVILRLFSANPSTPFVSWIYSISEFFIYLFRGIFPNLALTSGILDLVALIALLAYVLVAYLIVGVLNSLTRGTTDYDAYASHHHDIDEDVKYHDHHH